MTLTTVPPEQPLTEMEEAQARIKRLEERVEIAVQAAELREKSIEKALNDNQTSIETVNEMVKEPAFWNTIARLAVRAGEAHELAGRLVDLMEQAEALETRLRSAYEGLEQKSKQGFFSRLLEKFGW